MTVIQPACRAFNCSTPFVTKLPFGFLLNNKFTRAFVHFGCERLNFSSWSKFRTLLPSNVSIKSCNKCHFLSSSLSLVCWYKPAASPAPSSHVLFNYQQISYFSNWSNCNRIDRADLEETVDNFWRLYRKYHKSSEKSQQQQQKQQQQQQQQNQGQTEQDVNSNGNYSINDITNNCSSLGDTAGQDNDDENEDEDESWESIIERTNFQVWRRRVNSNSHLFQYKIYGSFDDIPAKAFFLVQLDTEFRKKWDKLVVRLDKVDQEVKSMSNRNNEPLTSRLMDSYSCANNEIEDEPHYSPSYISLASLSRVGCLNELPEGGYDSRNQVIHWVMHYPYPMYKREYCYIRRAWIEPKSHLMVIVAKSVDHPSCRTPSGAVRVSDYDSRMVIRPHEGKSFEENGFEYLLTYFDDPQSAFPSAAYAWMAYSGVPEFVNKLHLAAIQLNHELKHKSNLTSSSKQHSTVNNNNLHSNSNNNNNSNSNSNSNTSNSCSKSEAETEADEMPFTYA